ncbi:MAG: sugar ABC transporter permease [Chloroflexales bacterium]|nr:sugar ABC transporter permease [Chloroflexales bacterium]
MATIAQTLPEQRRHPSRRQRREWIEGYLFASPFIIGFLVFIAFPMGFSIYLIFHEWNLLTPPKYVGFENIAELLADPKAGQSLWNTGVFAIFGTIIQLLFAFVAALMLNQNIRFRSLYRTALYIPVIVPIVVSAFIWQRAYHPDFGIINHFLGWFGIPPHAWIFDVDTVMGAFIFMRMWAMGTMMVIFLAGLQNVPISLIEAASIDGANVFHRFRHITLPLMTPIIFFNLVVGLIGSFQVFAPALIMTKGGPEDATLFMVLYIYRQGFEYLNMGYAAALSWLLFLVIVVFTVVQFRLSQRWVYEG